MSEELVARLARRSAIQRDPRLGREPAWSPAGPPGSPGWPVVVHGELDEGYLWALVFGVDTQGPSADLAVQTPTDNLCIAHNRATGTTATTLERPTATAGTATASGCGSPPTTSPRWSC